MFKRTYSRMWAVATAHFSVDMLSSMNAVTFTFLSAHLMTLSKAQIGLAISLYGLAGAFSQPFFGWFADKTGGKYLGVFGAAWLAAMLMLAYFAGISTQSYPLMVVLLALASLGSGAFHPVGALHTAETDKAHSARNLTYFFLAGQLGLALGPALAGWLLDQTMRDGGSASISPLLLLTLVALPGIVWMQRTLPSRQQHTETHPTLVGEAGSLRGIPVYPLLFLALVVALRSLSNPGAATFLPSLFEEKGWTAEHYGQVTSMYWLAGAFSALVVTPLAGRFGSRAVIGGTMLLGAPMFWLLPQADGAWAMLLALLGGGLTGASHSLIVAEGQRLMPSRKGLAAGATLGFIFGTGALGSLIMGGLAEQVGLTTTFEIVAVVTVVSAVLGWFMPSTERRQAAEVAAATP